MQQSVLAVLRWRIAGLLISRVTKRRNTYLALVLQHRLHVVMEVETGPRLGVWLFMQHLWTVRHTVTNDNHSRHLPPDLEYSALTTCRVKLVPLKCVIKTLRTFANLNSPRLFLSASSMNLYKAVGAQGD